MPMLREKRPKLLRHLVPGPLPFESASFDVVFSKDAIVHIPDKAALHAHRIQNPRRTSR
jgi:hypothetical protein